VIKSYDGRAPASGFERGIAKRHNMGVMFQDLSDDFFLVSDASAVNDANGGEAEAVTFGQVFLDDGFYISG
jgi:hypothetical protein